MLSKQLQTSSLDFGASRRLIDGCTATLREKRTDEYIEKIWSEACKTADEVGTEKPSERAEKDDRKRARRLPQNLADSVTYCTTGSRSVDEAVDMQTLYRQKIFAVVDSLLGEINRRFTENDELLYAVSVCDPNSRSFLSEEGMTKIIEAYEKLPVCRPTVHLNFRPVC